MRFMIARWYIVPIAAMAALYLCSMGAVGVARSREEARVRSLVDRVYSLIQKGDFSELRRSHLVSEDGLHFLEMQDQCFGRVEGRDLAAPTTNLDRSWDGSVFVRRARLDSTERVSGPDSHSMTITLGDGQDKLAGDTYSDHGRRPVSSIDQALAIGRPIIHKTDASEKIQSITAEKTGSYWLIVEAVVGQGETGPNRFETNPGASSGLPTQPSIGTGNGSWVERRYLVLSQTG